MKTPHLRRLTELVRSAFQRQIRGALAEISTLANRRTLLLLTLALIAAFVFTIVYVERETPTWFWDYANYHEKYKELIKEFHNGIFPFIGFVRRSVLHSQHNVTPIVPLLPGRLLLGPHRVGYILNLVIAYLFPACLLTALLTRRAWGQAWGATSLLSVTAYALIYVPYWAPTLRGHPDVVCVLPLACATLLLIHSRYLHAATPGRSMVIGLLLWSAFLLRRHTIFTVIALIVATTVFAIIEVLTHRRAWGRTGAGRWLLHLACLLVALILPAMIFQHDYVMEITGQSYAATFSAYRQEISSQLNELYRFFGPVLLVSAAAGALLALARGAGGVLFTLLVPLLTFLGFQKAQAPSDHHLLILSLFLFPASCVPFVLIGAYLRGSLRRPLTALWLAVPAFGFLHTFPLQTADADLPSSPLAAIAPPRTYPPLRLESYEEVRRLVKDMKAIERQQRGTTFAILASSDQLNTDIVRSLGSRSLRESLVGVGGVDLRDAFRLQVLDADYIVACDPPAIHLGEEHERVITVPSRALREPGNPLHDSYQRLPGRDYHLADGTTAFVYKRIRPRTEAEVIWLHLELQRHYPSWQRYESHLGKPRGGF